MADSEIKITALATVGGVGTIALSWTGEAGSCLGYLALDKYEVWAAATNNRAGATKIGETNDITFSHDGLTTPSTRYYWARGRDLSGNLGDFYPLSATGGRKGETSEEALEPLTDQFDTAILEERTERITEDAATATRVDGVVASYNEVSAEGRIAWVASAGPSGWDTELTATLSADVGDTHHDAYWSLLLDSSGENAFTVKADAFYLRNEVAGVLTTPFEVVDGEVHIVRLRISGSLVLEDTVDTSQFTNNAAFVSASFYDDDSVYSDSSSWTELASVTLTPKDGIVIVDFRCKARSTTSAFPYHVYRLYRDSTLKQEKGWFVDDLEGERDVTLFYRDTGAGHSEVTYTVVAKGNEGGEIGNNFRTMVVNNYKKTS